MNFGHDCRFDNPVWNEYSCQEDKNDSFFSEIKLKN